MSATCAIALIRCAPGSPESDRLYQWIKHSTADDVLLFFQAAGVEHAVEEGVIASLPMNRFCMQLCEGSWRRRFDQTPPAGFSLGSLIDFLTRLDDAHVQLECFSALA